MSTGVVDQPDTVDVAGGVSRYEAAWAGFNAVLDVAVGMRRIEAMHAAVRVDTINLAVAHAMNAYETVTDESLCESRRRDLAYRSVIAELSVAMRISERTMTRMASDAWALANELPATLEALRAGAIDEAHARVILSETVALGAEIRGGLDVELAKRAETVTPGRLRRVARRLCEKFQAESVIDRHERARGERRVELYPGSDGMAWLSMYLAASDAMLIRDRLDRIANDVNSDPTRVNVNAESAGGEGAVVDLRTPDQLRADVARDLLLEGVPPIGEAFHVAAATVRPTVHVTVPVMTLLGGDDAPGAAELDGYGPIDPQTARELAARAPSFTRLLTHPLSGTVLDIDRTTYRPPADLARWLRVRDQVCRFPGCNRRAARCEIDHIQDWAHGGTTTFDNLAHLCPNHHHLKHETTWSVRHVGDGALEWYSPAGRRYQTTPGNDTPTVNTASPPTPPEPPPDDSPPPF